MKIDLVYTWVNSKDEKWQKRKDFWAKKCGIEKRSENNVSRFSDNDELRHSLRSAGMYAPWINHIYIITDRQTPEWLDTSHPKISIVDHRDIMPKSALPTFNSYAIETGLANVSELSEHFLFANDDFFFAAPVEPDYFFDDNENPYINFMHHRWEVDAMKRNSYVLNVMHNIDTFSKKYALSDLFFRFAPFHNIDGYRKSYFLECNEIFKEEVKEVLKCKFRTKYCWHRSIVALYMYKVKGCIIKESPITSELYEYEQVENMVATINEIKYIQTRLKKSYPLLMCINDGDAINDGQRRKFANLLEELFPVKQPWEK